MKRARNGSQHQPPPDPRGLLLAKKTELLGNLEEARFDTLALMGRVAEDDQAQISHEEFISLRCNSIDYETLRMVDDALERVGAGEYGICQFCEEPIAPRRLQAIPWAKYCVVCQDRVAAMAAAGVFEEAEVAI